MATSITHLMTAEEFFDYRPRSERGDVLCELDRGEVVEMGPPGIRHGVVCFNVNGLLWEYVRKRGRGYVAANDSGLIVERDPDSVFAPDVSYFDQSPAFDEVEVKYSGSPRTLLKRLRYDVTCELAETSVSHEDKATYGGFDDPNTMQTLDSDVHSLSTEFAENQYSERMPQLAVEVLSTTDRFGRIAERVGRFLAAGIPLVWVIDPQARDVTVYRSGREPIVIDENGRLVAEDLLPGFDAGVSDLFSVPGSRTRDAASGSD